MKQGQTLQALSSEIISNAKRRRDFLVNTPALDVIATPEAVAVRFEDVSIGGTFALSDVCFQQMSSATGIPMPYARRMRDGSVADRELLAANMKHWLRAQPSRNMLRCFASGEDNGRQLPSIARAFLSERFRPLDNYDLANAIIPKLERAGCIIESAQMTERRLYIQARTPRVEGQIKVGDAMQAGVVISNSEVGCGSLKIEPMLFRLVCSNGLILPNSLRKYHVGSRRDDTADVSFWSAQTQRLTDRAIFAQCSDTVDAALNDIQFRAQLDRIREKADGKSVATPPAIVEVLTKRLELSDGEGANVLQHLVTGGSLDIWGITNAVTRAAEDCADYDRAIELERAGAAVLEMKPQDFANN